MRGSRLHLSLYELHEILRAFTRPIEEGIRRLAIGDPFIKHLGQITKGDAEARFAALVLDRAFDQFIDVFEDRNNNLSRDALVSTFLRALYPNKGDDIVDYKAVNRYCGQRRTTVAHPPKLRPRARFAR